MHTTTETEMQCVSQRLIPVEESGKKWEEVGLGQGRHEL